MPRSRRTRGGASRRGREKRFDDDDEKDEKGGVVLSEEEREFEVFVAGVASLVLHVRANGSDHFKPSSRMDEEETTEEEEALMTRVFERCL